VDLARRGIKVKQFVAMLEDSVIELLAGRGERKPGAPGVYVGGAKIAALGIRVSRGRAYHGLALNVDMDLAPFAAIDPCGYPGLAVTQTRDLGIQEIDGRNRRRARRDFGRETRACVRPGSRRKVAPRPSASRSRSCRASRSPSRPGSACAPRGRIRAFTRSRTSCASRSCTQFARKPPARTSPSASARAPRPS